MSTVARAPQPTDDRIHVLLVDDVPDNRELYTLYLRSSGLQVSEASDGVQALARFDDEPLPDVVVTDIVLPDLDGFELCRRLRARSTRSDLPVIAITALPLTDRELSDAREAGASVLLQKPCLPETLLMEIRALVASRLRSTA